MNVVAKSQKRQEPPDFSLLMARVESRLLAGEDNDQCRRLLARQDIIDHLSPEQQLEWSRLVQMAGDTESANRLLADLTHKAPRMIEAWRERAGLLCILDDRPMIKELLAEASKHLDPETCAELKALFRRNNYPAGDSSIDAASRPFEAYRDRRDMLDHFMACFAGREDCFARQWADKQSDKSGYTPVRRSMTVEDLEDHLSGRKTYGIYLLRKDARVHTAVIDADLAKAFRTNPPKKAGDIVRRDRAYLFSRIREISVEMGMSPVAEFSGGKGYHFWFLFESPIPAAKARQAAGAVIGRIEKDLEAFNLELFPKQDGFTGKGLGNLVKLPLGVHRLTGKQSFFTDCRDRSVDAQLRHLHRVRRSNGTKIKVASGSGAAVITHPASDEEDDAYPELYRLKRGCKPLGKIMAVCKTRQSLTFREEKVLLQTIGLLPRSRLLIHYLLSKTADYDPHLADSKLTRIRGTPMGCKRIHSLLGYEGPLCDLEKRNGYVHPLLLIPDYQPGGGQPSAKIENLTSAVENLKQAIVQVERFLK